MISDKDMVVNKFISVPRELCKWSECHVTMLTQRVASLNCGAFVAGIVEAVLDGAHFVSLACHPVCSYVCFLQPAERVTAHTVAEKVSSVRSMFDWLG